MMLGHGEFWGGVPNDKVHLYLSKENPNPSLDVRLTKGDSPHTLYTFQLPRACLSARAKGLLYIQANR